MNRYLTIHIPETAAPAPVSHFLRTQAGLTKKQISQAKFRPSGVQKNGQQCRVTETAYPGDQITVCLETDDVDSLHLESSSFTISSDSHSFPLSTDSGSYSDSTASEFAGSDANSHIYHSPSTTSQLLPELEILYEDQDILAVNKPAGLVTHPSGSHYSDSLSNQVAAYFRSKDEPTKVRSIGRLDKNFRHPAFCPKSDCCRQITKTTGKWNFRENLSGRGFRFHAGRYRRNLSCDHNSPCPRSG